MKESNLGNPGTVYGYSTASNMTMFWQTNDYYSGRVSSRRPSSSGWCQISKMYFVLLLPVTLQSPVTLPCLRRAQEATYKHNSGRMNSFAPTYHPWAEHINEVEQAIDMKLWPNKQCGIKAGVTNASILLPDGDSSVRTIALSCSEAEWRPLTAVAHIYGGFVIGASTG